MLREVVSNVPDIGEIACANITAVKSNFEEQYALWNLHIIAMVGDETERQNNSPLSEYTG